MDEDDDVTIIDPAELSAKPSNAAVEDVSSDQQVEILLDAESSPHLTPSPSKSDGFNVETEGLFGLVVKLRKEATEASSLSIPGETSFFIDKSPSNVDPNAAVDECSPSSSQSEVPQSSAPISLLLLDPSVVVTSSSLVNRHLKRGRAKGKRKQNLAQRPVPLGVAANSIHFKRPAVASRKLAAKQAISERLLRKAQMKGVSAFASPKKAKTAQKFRLKALRAQAKWVQRNPGLNSTNSNSENVGIASTFVVPCNSESSQPCSSNTLPKALMQPQQQLNITVGGKKKRVVKSKTPNGKSRIYEASEVPDTDSHEQASFSGNTTNNSNIEAVNLVDNRYLRPVVIDGCNVAFGHSGSAKTFSSRGVWLCARHWRDQGHKVHIVIPKGGKDVLGGQVTEYHLLEVLEASGEIRYSPTRQVPFESASGLEFRTIKPYDDRLIIQIAYICGGVVISNDNFRDIAVEHPQWRETIEKRVIMYTWLEDVIIFPLDPAGRCGPCLSDIVRFPVGVSPPLLRATEQSVPKPKRAKKNKRAQARLSRLNVNQSQEKPSASTKLPTPTLAPGPSTTTEYSPYSDGDSDDCQILD